MVAKMNYTAIGLLVAGAIAIAVTIRFLATQIIPDMQGKTCTAWKPTKCPGAAKFALNETKCNMCAQWE